MTILKHISPIEHYDTCLYPAYKDYLFVIEELEQDFRTLIQPLTRYLCEEIVHHNNRPKIKNTSD